MLLWFKMIQYKNLFIYKVIPIFYDLMIFYENFTSLIYHENNLVRYKMNFIFKIYLFIKILMNEFLWV